MIPLIYNPPQTTRIKVDMVFLWNGKEYKVKEISLKGYKDHFLNDTKKVGEK